jgi:hypothetical protein
MNHRSSEDPSLVRARHRHRYALLGDALSDLVRLYRIGSPRRGGTSQLPLLGLGLGDQEVDDLLLAVALAGEGATRSSLRPCCPPRRRGEGAGGKTAEIG